MFKYILVINNLVWEDKKSDLSNETSLEGSRQIKKVFLNSTQLTEQLALGSYSGVFNSLYFVGKCNWSLQAFSQDYGIVSQIQQHLYNLRLKKKNNGFLITTAYTFIVLVK